MKPLTAIANRYLRLCCCLGSLLVLSVWACDTRDEPVADYSHCRYDKPEAIFYDGLPQISDHRFVMRGRGSEESFTLSGGIDVSILQYGCDQRTQEFVFDLGQRSNCQEQEDCIRQVVHLLQTLSRLGPEYHVFRAWAQAIKEISPQLVLGQSTPLAEGFWVKIDQNQRFGHTTLSLLLSEKA